MNSREDALRQVLQLIQGGRLKEADALCGTIVAADPGVFDAWHLWGYVHQRMNNGPLAAKKFLRCVELEPTNAVAHNSLGLAYQMTGQSDLAIECFRRAVTLNPNSEAFHHNLAHALHQQGAAAQAADHFRLAAKLQPTEPVLWADLGKALHGLSEFAEAMSAYQRAFDLGWPDAEMLSNMATLHKQQGEYARSTDFYREALRLEPGNVELRFNLACGVLAEGQLDMARLLFESILTKHAEHAESHYNLACLLLLHGDFRRGWAEYEWRWRTGQQQPRNFQQPLWTGQPLAGKTILLHAEQGLGDTFQFIRYAGLLKPAGATVLVECPRRLGAVLANCPGVDQFIEVGTDLPGFDYHCPLLSLPRVFNTALETIPRQVPYLFARPELVEHWRRHLRESVGTAHPTLIGIHWRGRAGQGSFRQRDLPLESFQLLANSPQVRLVSLQKGAAEELAHFSDWPNPILDLGDDLDRDRGAFADTAAIMAGLDLVITSDTSIAHLAGALGVPVWVALPHTPDWRWLLGRSDSPWYPTMRLFRQQRPGDWSGVFAAMAMQLASLTARSNPAH